jgi:dolichyl-diphosphooligosaccharide--protein glycosyltransferase
MDPASPARRRDLFVSVGLFTLALAVRGLPFATVFEGSRIWFFDYDAYYHMRRVLYSLAHFPSVLEFDPYLNFPQGAQAIWPPLFDRLLSLVLLPFHVPGHPESVERIAVWIPPVLGAATVVAAHHIARRHFGGASALLSGALLCLLPAHFAYSQLSFIDHHVAVCFASTLLLGATMAFLARRELRVDAADIGLALLPGGILLLWPGALLEVAVVELALLAWLAGAPDAERAASRAGRLAILHTASLALVIPEGMTAAWLQWNSFSPVVISRFQPWLFALLALHALACRVLWRRRGGQQLWRRLADSAAIGGALVGASVLALPGLDDGAFDAWRWLTRAEAFQSSVLESRPLFLTGSTFGTGDAEFFLSRLVYAFPLLVGWLAWDARRREDVAARLLLVSWSIAFAAVSVAQRRFVHTFSVSFALVIGAVAPLVWRIAAGHRTDVRRRAAAAATCFALLLWLLAPIATEYTFHLRNLAAHLAHQPLALDAHAMRMRAAGEAARWLREHSPPTSGFLEPEVEPEYGVLADFGYGHLILYVARRPTVIGNFGDDVGAENLWLVLRFMHSESVEAIRILERLRVRYVLLEVFEDVPGHFSDRAMLRLLARPEPASPSRLRLLHETSPALRPRFRIFEFVDETPSTRMR